MSTANMNVLNLWKNTCITVAEHGEILRNMQRLLNKYDYEWSECALDEIIEVWANNKQDIIRHFRTHPNYLEGEFMIVFSHNYDRKIHYEAGYDFINWLGRQYGDGGREWEDAYICVRKLLYQNSKFVSKEVARDVNEMLSDAHIREGEKTTRAVNKVCGLVGMDKIRREVVNPTTGRVHNFGYDFEFAKLSDAYSPLQIVRQTVLSVNPLDYLTMSFGNSWASCHTIDKQNYRRSSGTTYQGCYSSGTISYMLDGTSMVFYTVDTDYNGDEFWNQDKITRQMFHWGEEKLIQGRLYPQSNDGYGDNYQPTRAIVQKLVSEMWDFPNRWKVSKGAEEAGKYICSEGTHYEDYRYYNDCTLSRIRNSENKNVITVGHVPICVTCGCGHNQEDNISCCAGDQTRCECCGAVVYEDDAIWINGDAYCNDCAHVCDWCEEYTTEDLTTAYGAYRRWGRYEYNVCPYCLENNFTFCVDCEEYFESELTFWHEGAQDYVCEECMEDNSSTCDKCGELFYSGTMTEDDEEGLLYCEYCYGVRLAERQEAVAELEAQGTPRIAI